LGRQQFLCGNPGRVDEFFESVPEGTESSLVFEWLCLGMMYADDGGAGLQFLARTWLNCKRPSSTRAVGAQQPSSGVRRIQRCPLG
jgi:hypothetical protein